MNFSHEIINHFLNSTMTSATEFLKLPIFRRIDVSRNQIVVTALSASESNDFDDKYDGIVRDYDELYDSQIIFSLEVL